VQIAGRVFVGVVDVVDVVVVVVTHGKPGK